MTKSGGGGSGDANGAASKSNGAATIIATEGSEMEALVGDRAGDVGTTSPLDRLSSHAAGVKYRKGQVVSLLLLFLTALLLLVKYEEVGEWFSGHEEDVEVKPDDEPGTKSKGKWGLPDLSLPDWLQIGGGGGGGWWGGGGDEQARRSLPELLESLQTARGRVDALLTDDYGEYAFVFNRTYTMSNEGIMFPSRLSLDRLKRRMKVKVIESQLRGVGEFESAEEEDPVTFTWATGGHSASAAHGDLLEQSYTVSMERAADIAFGSVDINFKSRHFGMGTASSPELSLCMDEIYGKDIDVILWDFGMTDGRNLWYYHLWVDQAGNHPTFPMVMGRDNGGRHNIHRECESRGQGAFTLKGPPHGLLPDSEVHPDPKSLPRALAYYMCGGKAETQGVCQDYKFDTKYCSCRGKVSWHPGWKDHLFLGRFLASFLIENLVDAIKEMHERDLALSSGSTGSSGGGGGGNDTSLATSDGDDGGTAFSSLSGEYLQQLRNEEEADRQKFLASTVTNDIGNGRIIGEDNWKTVLRSNPICRSQRLPNQARFDGLMDGIVATDTGPGGYHTGYSEHFKWDTLPPPGPPLPNDTLKSAIPGLRPPWMMATDQEMRKPMDRYFPRTGCNLTVNHDFRDGFTVRHEDGMMGDVYPNDREVEAFSRGTYERQGFLVMCNTQCLFSNCDPGGKIWELKHVGHPDRNANVTIIIDDQIATSAVNFAANCHFLARENGNFNWGPGTKKGRKGQYEIKFQVHQPGKVIISSLIVV